MLIRVAQAEDCERIGVLWSQLVAYHRSLDAVMPEAAQDGPQRYAARIQSLLNDPYSRTYVAVVDGEIVGYITGMIADMRLEMFAAEVTGFIGDVFVDEANRERGIGRAWCAPWSSSLPRAMCLNTSGLWPARMLLGRLSGAASARARWSSACGTA